MKKHFLNNVVSQSRPVIFFALVLAFLPFSLSFAASVPQLVNYQGMLTDAQGEPLETKEYKLSFWIFSQATGGTAVWGPQVFNSVPVVRGHFNVILGPKDSSNRDIANAFVTANAYLEIKVADGAPITPRQQVLSTPYAVRALHGVPTGTIAAFWGDAAPPGWLLCQGQPVPAGPGYDELRGIVGSNVPDLRGLFLRGRNQGRTDGWKDPEERPIGGLQVDASRRPNNAFTTDSSGNHNHGITLYHYDNPNNGGQGQESYHWNVREKMESDAGAHAHSITGGGDFETRPKNICINWIIKY